MDNSVIEGRVTYRRTLYLKTHYIIRERFVRASGYIYRRRRIIWRELRPQKILADGNKIKVKSYIITRT